MREGSATVHQAISEPQTTSWINNFHACEPIHVADPICYGTCVFKFPGLGSNGTSKWHFECTLEWQELQKDGGGARAQPEKYAHTGIKTEESISVEVRLSGRVCKSIWFPLDGAEAQRRYSTLERQTPTRLRGGIRKGALVIFFEAFLFDCCRRPLNIADHTKRQAVRRWLDFRSETDSKGLGRRLRSTYYCMINARFEPCKGPARYRFMVRYGASCV